MNSHDLTPFFLQDAAMKLKAQVDSLEAALKRHRLTFRYDSIQIRTSAEFL